VPLVFPPVVGYGLSARNNYVPVGAGG
jgi:hypothetical protein